MDIGLSRIISTMLASAARVVNVRESPSRSRAFLHDVICFFTARVTQAGSDASLGCAASVVGFVVLHFLSHDDLLLLVVENTATRRARIARIC
jgi:hypothetical protein